MKTKTLTLLLLTLCTLPWLTANASQTIISNVPNYDQDVFPIGAAPERGDCAPVACTMVHGYYDANGWPRLIPYGGNVISQNAWGIDTVVRKYKVQMNYVPNEGVYYSRLELLRNVLGSSIVGSFSYFDPTVDILCDDDDWTTWSRIQSHLNDNRPCVLLDWPSGAIDSYKWEGEFTLNELGGAHGMCAIGWSDVGGRWVICNMGWSYSVRGWMNYDGDDDWQISYITLRGSPSDEDDDAYEDNDTISTAHQIGTGTINNLRCLDTLILNGYYFKARYGDWYKVTASSGQTLSVTTTFTHANGDLDLQVYNPSQTEVGSSTGSANSENVTIPSTIAGSYYIFVYGYNNATNQNYSLSVSLTSAAVSYEPMQMSIQMVGGSCVLTWPLGALLSADELTGPWTPEDGATSPWTNTPGVGKKFYRLMQ